MNARNRGFTLVELIVSCSILGIIAAATAGFLMAGTRTYGSVNTSVRLQYETQLAMNQLQEYVIDCNAGTAWDSGTKTLYLLRDTDGSRQMDVISYDSSAQELRFGKGPAAETPVTATQLLAEHVTELRVDTFPSAEDPARLDAAQMVLTMELSGKSESVTQIIALRNQPLYADSWSALWAAAQE